MEAEKIRVAVSRCSS